MASEAAVQAAVRSISSDRALGEMLKEVLTPRVVEAPATVVGEKPLDDGGDDARTLNVDDMDGVRFKDWKSTCAESRTERYPDSPIVGPPSALDLCWIHPRVAGDPRRWFSEWIRSKKIEDTDRIAREMKPLVECLYHAGTFNQLNFGGVVCLESIASRIETSVHETEFLAWAVLRRRPRRRRLGAARSEAVRCASGQGDLRLAAGPTTRSIGRFKQWRPRLLRRWG